VVDGAKKTVSGSTRDAASTTTEQGRYPSGLSCPIASLPHRQSSWIHSPVRPYIAAASGVQTGSKATGTCPMAFL